jgi:hypothetical protein
VTTQWALYVSGLLTAQDSADEAQHWTFNGESTGLNALVCMYACAIPKTVSVSVQA